MIIRNALPGLETLWVEDGPEQLRCYECNEPFDNGAVVRTFKLNNGNNAIAANIGTKTISVLGDKVTLFNRHLHCLRGKRYTTVSHVWDPAVSTLQALGSGSSRDPETLRRIFQTPIRIYKALSDFEDESCELWHDYFSVPQWNSGLKLNIIKAIPDIFQHAAFTLVFMDDVNEEMIQSLNDNVDAASGNRMAGITGICNAKWFKRVWTIMEYVRSPRVKVMIADYNVHQDIDDVFLSRLDHAWDMEVAHTNDVHATEGRADLDHNLVPWNLGPVQRSRDLGRVDFGLAYVLLSRRGCSSFSDFFHALLGIVYGKLEEPLSQNPTEALHQISRACIKAGDYSSLFMTPRMKNDDHRLNSYIVNRHGFNDVFSFGLGARTTDPIYKDATFTNDMIELTLVKVGTVRRVTKLHRSGNSKSDFARAALEVLSVTGPDAVVFAESLAVRLYCQNQIIMADILQDNEKMRELEDILVDWDNRTGAELTTGNFWDNVSRIGSLLGLDAKFPLHGIRLPRLQFLETHGLTIHAINSSGFVGVTCGVCTKMFVFRAAMYETPTNVRGAVVYRIPGLSYDFTRPDGMCFLVNDGRIVGKLLWATPACECGVTERVQVSVADVPLPWEEDVRAATEGLHRSE